MAYFFKKCVRITHAQNNWMKENRDKTGEPATSFMRRAVRKLINEENKEKDKD